MTTQQAFHACTRFGLGARPDELAEAAADPRGWLLAQLQRFPREGGLAVSKRGRELSARLPGLKGERRKALVKQLDRVYQGEVGRRLAGLAETTMSFPERLVMFWSNHFCISVVKPELYGLAASYETEAIRPHVLGSFEDMLVAALRHPAMLIYLDNQKSFGPNSQNVVMKRPGLNENLARETLELYTLGVEGGYTQADVIALAKILTGWTLRLHPFSRRPMPDYRFQPSLHEPGSKQLLGKRFAGNGEREGIAALRMLARHPATARFVARKLAVHFVADRPPQAAVDGLAEVYLRTGGDLAALAQALIDLDAAWQAPLAKFKTPLEFVISTLRLLDNQLDGRKQFGALRQMGQPLWWPSSPAGFADRLQDWANPDALYKRISWGHRIGTRAGGKVDPRELAKQVIGPMMSKATRFAIDNAPSRQDGLALLLASPEFQRR